MSRLSCLDLRGQPAAARAPLRLPEPLPFGWRLDDHADSAQWASALLLVLDRAPPGDPTLHRLTAAAGNGEAPYGKPVLLAVSPDLPDGETEAAAGRVREALRRATAFVFPLRLPLAADTEGALSLAAADLAEFFAYAESLRRFLNGATSAELQAAGTGSALLRGLWLNHLNLPTRDLARSCAFYIDRLGARFVKHLGPEKIVLNLNGFDLFLQQVAAAEAEAPADFHIGLRVDKPTLMTLAQRLPAAGVEIVQGPGTRLGPYTLADGYRTAFYVRDPDGYLVEVYTPEREMLVDLPA